MLKLKVNKKVEEPQIVLDPVFEKVSTKKGTSLSDLYTKSLNIQDECKDFTVSCSDYTPVYRAKDNSIRFLNNRGVPVYYSFTRYSLGQLCTKIGVPSSYIRKCLSTDMGSLAETNINAWMSEFDKTLFIRTYQNSIRGVLSDRYTVLDTPSIIESVADVVDMDDYTIKGYFLSPDRFHARIVQKEMLDVEGEDLFAGIQIDSSDVGRSILQVEFFIFKQVCTNGLCIPKFGGSIFRQKHIGMGISEFQSSFSESMKKMKVLCESATELIEDSINSRNYLWKGSLSKLSEDDLEHLYKGITSTVPVSDDSAKKVVDLMQNRYGNNKWGYINSLTEVAQDYTLERRIEIENRAGAILVA